MFTPGVPVFLIYPPGCLSSHHSHPPPLFLLGS
nr:MAG TPA: hypothetical protein [Caudoviricetes sp.]